MIIGRVLIAVLMHHGAQALYYAVRRRQAIWKASTTSSVRKWSALDQPMTGQE
jgi:hypothetical protein